MTTYYVLKNSALMLNLPGHIAADGTVRLTDRAQPIVLKDECAKRGLDPKAVRDAGQPVECLGRPGMNAGNVEILTETEFRKREEEKRLQKEAELEKAFPCLSRMRELRRKASDEAWRYQRAFQRMMEDEFNDGVRPPRAENRAFEEELNALYIQHPRTALYLKAEIQAQGTTSYSATSGAMTAGKKAMQLLVEGAPIDAVQEALKFRYEFVD